MDINQLPADAETPDAPREAGEPAEPYIDIPQVLASTRSFLSGEAGTGKTFLARAMQRQWPGTVLASTTGIAAVNLGEGTTINGLLKYFDTNSLRDAYMHGQLTSRLLKLAALGVKRILIDEVSMMDGDQLTILTDALNEMNGEGYVLDADSYDRIAAKDLDPISLVLVGDFAQLPPVKAPFAFESTHWPHYAQAQHKLTEIRRQAQADFIRAIQATRRGDAATACSYFGPHFHPSADPDFPGTTILAKNEEVARFNHMRLQKLQTPERVFASSRWGTERGEWKKDIPLQFPLKEGALVMLLANHRGRGFEGEPGPIIYANGDLGTVTHIDVDHGRLYVQLQRNGREEEVQWVTRTNTVPLEPGRKKELKAQGQLDKITEDGKHEIVGGITYLPVRLAYATTVHKCCNAETRIRVADSLLPMRLVQTGDFLHAGGHVYAVARSEQKAVQITTRRGYTISASMDHRWLTSTGWVSTEEIAAHLGGVAIQLNLGPVIPAGLDRYAWWLGATVGNGNYTHRKEGQIHFSTLNSVFGQAWASTALDLGASRVSPRKDRRGFHLTSKSLREKLAADGLDYVKAPSKSIPAVVWTSGPAAWSSFIRGLFDADGSVGKSFVVLTTASETLGIEVQELLLHLGVISTRTRYMGKRDPYWQVRVDAEGLPAFKIAVGFSVAAKARKLAATNPNRVLRPSGGFDAVMSVVSSGIIVPMVDLEVAAPHVIGTGPFRSHNSQGLSLDSVQVDIREGFFKAPSMVYVALSRARTIDGLRLVGNVDYLKGRCTVDARVKPWL